MVDYLLNNTVKHLTILFVSCGMSSVAFANPMGSNLEEGSATINQAPGVTEINQTSQQAIINWQSFNIGAGEKTQFIQPNNSAVVLNRIDPKSGASQILGQLTANGRIILVNQAGIFFGPGALVDVGGIMASTSDISNSNFLSGKYIFDQPSSYAGSIVNQGTIRTADYGLVALMGTSVQNDGYIHARLGNVVLASGNKFTVDLYGDQLINFTVDEAAQTAGVDRYGNRLKNGVNNTGAVIADGGTILMTGKTARGLVDNVVNMEGVLQAKSVSQRNGVIILDGREDRVRVSGRIIASGKDGGQRGGKVKILAKEIVVRAPAIIDVSGDQGGGEVLIGGNAHGAGPEQHADYVFFEKGATVLANALTYNDGGKVVVWSDIGTQFYGSIYAEGGAQSGNGGWIETSGKEWLDWQGSGSARAPAGINGSWLLDPRNVTINAVSTTNGSFNGFTSTNSFTPTADNATVLNTTINALLNASTNVIINTGSTGTQDGDITISAPITWTTLASLTLSANRNIILTAPITNTTNSSASLNLIANNAGAFNIGSTFGVVSQSPNTINLMGAVNIYYNPTNYMSPVTYTNQSAGALTAYMLVNNLTELQNMKTQVSNNYALSTNIDASGITFVPIASEEIPFSGNFDGQSHVISNLFINLPAYWDSELPYPRLPANGVGLFSAVSGHILNVGLENVNVIGAVNTGGLTGELSSGSISNSYVTGRVVSTYQTGGGLVGKVTNSTINSSYSSANVSSIIEGDTLGGLVGILTGSSSINNAYSTGSVTSVGAGNKIGGLVGDFNFSSPSGTNTITNSYSSGAVSGSGQVGGLIGAKGGTSTATNSFWDTNTSLQSTSAAGVGLTTTQSLTQSNYSGWDFNNVWFIPNYGNTTAPYTRPLLRSEYNTTINNGHQLQLIAMDSMANYTLARNIDLNNILNSSDIWATSSTSGKGFISLGPSTSSFSGVFDGKGYVIKQLYIIYDGSTPLTSAALFSKVDGTIRNVGVINTNIHMTIDNGGGGTLVSLLAGGLIERSYSSGLIHADGLANQVTVGGLVGTNSAGTITDSYSTAAVTASGTDPSIIFQVGGLVGNTSAGTISSSYSTGYVNIDSGSSFAGGTNVGGFVGFDDGSTTFTNNYWDTQTSGQLSSVDATAQTTAQLKTALPAGFSSSIWRIIAGTSYPYLLIFYPSTPRVISGTAPVGGGKIVNLASNGIVVDGISTGNNNSFYFLETLTNSSPYLLYFNNAGTVGNFLAKTAASNGSTTGLTFNPGAIQVNTGTGFSTSDMSTAVGALADSNILYSGNLTLGTSTNPNVILQTSGSGTFTINSNIDSLGTTTGMNFSTPVAITAGSVITSGSQTYNNPVTLGNNTGFGSSNNGDIIFNSTVNRISGALNTGLYVFTARSVTLGAVGNLSPIAFLNISKPMNLGGNITTTDGQGFNGPVTLTADITIQSSVAGNTIFFNNGITGVGRSLTIRGGSGVNTYGLLGPMTLHNITVDGVGGNDTLNLQTSSPIQTWSFTAPNAGTVTLPGQLTGVLTFNNIASPVGSPSNPDIFTFSGLGSVSGTVNGNLNGNNSIIGNNNANTWVLGNNSGTVAGMATFNLIQNITGGNSNDNFIFSGGSISGALNGGAGTNTLTGGNTWNITSPNAGTTSNVGSFSNIQNLSGGSSADSFNFSGTGELTGSINGGSGAVNTLTANNVANSWNITGTNSGTVTGIGSGFSNIQNLIGGTNTDNFILNGSTVSGFINGGGNTNSLTVTTGTANWIINNANAGSVTGISGGFSNIQNITGSNGINTFTFNNGTLNGDLVGSGSAANNTLAFNAYSIPVSVNLTTRQVRGIIGGTFSNINNFNGADTNLTANSTLIGLGNTTISGTNAGNSGATYFTGFGNLTGSGNNAFTFNANSSITGNLSVSSGSNTFTFLNGSYIGGNLTGAGSDILSVAGFTTPVFVNLAGSSSLVRGMIAGINNFTGTDAGTGFNSTLQGPTSLNNWIFTANTINTGTIDGTLSFNNFGNLKAGSSNNTFTFKNNASITGDLMGTESATLDISALTAPTVNLANQTTDSIGGRFSDFTAFISSGIDSHLIGPSSDTAWILNNPNAGMVGVNNFSGFDNITGGMGTNIFSFMNNSSVSGLLDGGNTTHVNIIDMSLYAEPVVLTLTIPTSGIELNTGYINSRASTPIATFNQIQEAIGTADGKSMLILPSKSNLSVLWLNAAHTASLIGDPFLEINFLMLNEPISASPSVVVPASSPLAVREDIAQIITPFTKNSAYELEITTPDAIELTDNTILAAQLLLDDQIDETTLFGCYIYTKKSQCKKLVIEVPALSATSESSN